MIGISAGEFQQLAEYIKANYGIYLKPEKQALVVGRLNNVLQDKGFRSFSDYFNYIITDKTGQGVNTLIEKITTNHTFFMREMEHFYFLRDKILPTIAATLREKDLRIWSAGCSSGEEPYTMAMIIDEFFAGDKKGWDTKILATDIASKVLETAKRGVYSAEKVASLPAYWRLSYLRSLDRDNFALIDKIKNEVIFRKFNLMEEVFPFKKKFHVIFCRNVMIYFDNKTKMDLVNKFYELTEPGGFLIIGHSETLNREKTNYKHIIPAVYRKV